jgi:hypothetical protein
MPCSVSASRPCAWFQSCRSSATRSNAPGQWTITPAGICQSGEQLADNPQARPALAARNDQTPGRCLQPDQAQPAGPGQVTAVTIHDDRHSGGPGRRRPSAAGARRYQRPSRRPWYAWPRSATGTPREGALRIRGLDQLALPRDRDPCQQRAPRGRCRRPDRSWERDTSRIGGPVVMGKAIGWVVIVALVLVLGTHPGIMAGFVHHLLAVLRGAGDELSSFVNAL